MVKRKKNKVKLKDIAEKAGVSVGTVDRVIHSRGEVNESTRQKVTDIINELGYKPNLQARSLAMKKTYRIFALLPSNKLDNNPFWKLPKAGIIRAIEEIDDYNVEVVLRYYSTTHKDSYIDAYKNILSENPDGVILLPFFSNLALEFSNILNEKNIPFVLIDSNLEKANAIGYFGQHAFKSGYLSAKLMSYGLTDNSTVLILNLTDSKSVASHLQKREKGFLSYLSKYKNTINVFSLNIDLGKKDEPFKSLKNAFQNNTKIAGIFVTGSRAYKVAEFICKTEKCHTLLVGYDLVEKNIKHLKKGHIDFLISQKPEEQGYKSVLALTKYLIGKQEIPRVNYSQIDIITKENIEFYNNL